MIESGYNYCLVGGALPPAELEAALRQDVYSSVQSNVHQWALIQGIEESTGRPMTLISSLLISDYPKNPRVLVYGRPWSHRDPAADYRVGFINLLGLKHLTRFVSVLFALLRWKKNSDERKHVVLLYGLVSAHMFAGIAARWFGRKLLLFNVFTDLPSQPLPTDGIGRRGLRKLDRLLLRFALGQMDGIVAVTSGIREDYAPAVPGLLLEGLLEPKTLERYEAMDGGFFQGGKVTVTYCGALSEKKGVGLLLQAFAQIRDLRFVLWLFGKGELEDRIRQAARHDPRIRLYGFVSESELAERLGQSDILVSVRPWDILESHYSFPSKIMEYMATGRPVITSRAGLPLEYHDYIYLLQTDTPEALAELILVVSGIPEAELRRAGQRARNFLRESKLARLQCARLVNFVEECWQSRRAH